MRSQHPKGCKIIPFILSPVISRSFNLKVFLINTLQSPSTFLAGIPNKQQLLHFIFSVGGRILARNAFLEKGQWGKECWCTQLAPQAATGSCPMVFGLADPPRELGEGVIRVSYSY